MTYGGLTWFYARTEDDLAEIGKQLGFPYKHYQAAGDFETQLLVYNILLAEEHPAVIVDLNEYPAVKVIELDDDC